MTMRTGETAAEAAARVMITPTEHNKREWSRMARAAYAAGRNDVGHRYSGAAAYLRIGESMRLTTWNMLQDGYRAWLVFGEWQERVYLVDRQQRVRTSGCLCGGQDPRCCP